jgi:TM2 domain-containing membrane protein YozV
VSTKRLDRLKPPPPSTRAILATILSLLVPGLGQIYLRSVVMGLVWLGCAAVLYYGRQPWLAAVVHVMAAMMAYFNARRQEPGRRRR